jgi:tRNASer (uridine44-2'-O)-methyltransferase
MKEKTESGFLDSMIGSLAAKTATIAEETGGSVEKAWLRTPGAINMALIGTQNGTGKDWPELNDDSSSADLVSARLRIMDVVERECFKDGGIQAAAQLWVERVNTLLRGNGTQHSVN